MEKYLFFSILFSLFFGVSNADKPTKPAKLPATDVLLKSVSYPDSGAFFALYQYGGEAIIGDSTYTVDGETYLNQFNEWECVDFKTGRYIVVSPAGFTRYWLGKGRETLLP